jgi:hypothetical protein
MKRAVILAALIAAVVAAAQQFVGQGNTNSKTLVTGGAGPWTGTCAALGATDGVDLTHASAFRVIATVPTQADGGVPSLAGGGSLDCCVRAAISASGVKYESTTQAWMDCDSALDVTTIRAGQPSYPAPDFATGVRAGRIAYVPNAVTADGGEQLNITVSTQLGAETR